MINGIQPGGQLTITTEVENYPGFAEAIQGPWLMEQMEAQAKNVGTNIVYDHIKEVDFSKRPFTLIGESEDIFEADSVIIATGAQASGWDWSRNLNFKDLVFQVVQLAMVFSLKTKK